MSFEVMSEGANVWTPRVLILSSQTLFAESLCELLEGHGYEVIGVQPYGEVTPAYIAAEQPSIVVLDTRGAPHSAASALLDRAADIRVVQVSLDSAVIAMYQRRESAATVHNFLELMANEDAESPGNAPGPGSEGRSADNAKL